VHYRLRRCISYDNNNNNLVDRYFLSRTTPLEESRHRSLWSLQITITLSESALLIFLHSGFEKLLAQGAGIEPTNLDLSPSSSELLRLMLPWLALLCQTVAAYFGSSSSSLIFTDKDFKFAVKIALKYTYNWCFYKHFMWPGHLRYYILFLSI